MKIIITFYVKALYNSLKTGVNKTLTVFLHLFDINIECLIHINQATFISDIKIY